MMMQEKDVWKFRKKKRGWLKDVYIKARRRFMKEFGRRKNQDGKGNMKLFWKEVSKANRGKVDNSSRIKDENGKL